MLPERYRQRLYLEDAKTLHFESTIQKWSVFSKDDDAAAKPSVILKQSAFYPESGGQLGDQGTLSVEGVVHSVVDVQLDDDGNVHHLLAEEPKTTPNECAVHGSVDGARRRQHRASHSGQHLLSRALFEACGANTVSARLGERTATIDLDRVLNDEEVEAALTLANQLVDEDREITASFPDSAMLQTLNMRKSPTVSEDIRVVQIAGFDATPCGGTHCERTGEIQLLHVCQLEKRKSGTRVHFVCGPRAREYLCHSDEILRDLAKRFTCGKNEIATVFEKGQREMRVLRDRVASLQAERIQRIAATLDENHDEQATIIWFDENLEAKEAPALLGALCTRLARASRVVALAGGLPKTHLVIARGEDSNFDCKAAFSRVSAIDESARGGGRPSRAQGNVLVDAFCDDSAESTSARFALAMSSILRGDSEN